ncbi:MAG: GxGYxYP family putative glycoside hydrolase [Ignavibacteriaceae bacterium]|nr:GxGYxYP family putative glycoside hydrolase [Ignavibacteriaceae bacterium]
MNFVYKTFIVSVIIFNTLFCFSCGSKTNPSSAIDNSVTYSGQPTRLQGSPYPVSQKPDTLFVINDNNFSDTELLTIQTLQGILAQTKPRIYRVRGDGYPLWLNDLKSYYEVTTNYTYSADLKGLLSHFKNEINGYLLTDGTQPSVNVAISLAGIKKGIVVYGSAEQTAKDAGIKLLEDVTNQNYQQFIDSYKDQMNKNLLCYNSVDKITFLSDYSVFGKMYYFYDDIASSLSNEILSQMNPNAPLLGWATDEYSLVNTVSKKGMVVHASDYALNLSVLSNVGVETKQPKYNTNPAVIINVHTVCFLMSDGDNFSWLVNDFYTNPNWYASKSRTKINMGWTLAPALCELAPTLMKRFYDNEGTADGGRDYFVAGPSGFGYAYPESYTHLNDFVDLTSRYMKKADQRILNIIGNSIDTKYLQPFLQQDQIDAVIYYYYSDYAGGKGAIYWVNGKPVITGRYQLWSGQTDSPESLAQKINSLSTDITSSKGYSLIPVHAWQNTVEDVATCISLLNKNVRVVTPDEFVALIKKNISH